MCYVNQQPSEVPGVQLTRLQTVLSMLGISSDGPQSDETLHGGSKFLRDTRCEGFQTRSRWQHAVGWDMIVWRRAN